ncbi:MAG: alpha-amylase, partial [Bacteroidales bacterium]|nr:alpha-amylase [Bacteroidales bacterium]
IKWLTDFIREFGIDGFRVDTVKHTEADVWSDLFKEAQLAFAEWKDNNKEALQEEQDFFMLGEVYNYNALSGKDFDFGDRKVNYFDHGFGSLINFGFKGDANKSYENLFNTYSVQLNTGDLYDVSILNYVSSHDDGHPFDKDRKRTFESATKLLLSPGMAQIYYGDEIARPLQIQGTQGDANLRGMMSWEEKEQNELFEYWQKLGQFRQRHPSIGAGDHRMINEEPYFFIRSYVKGSKKDRVIIGLDLPKTAFTIHVGEYFEDGSMLYDRYGDEFYPVINGGIHIKTKHGIVLIEPTRQ